MPIKQSITLQDTVDLLNELIQLDMPAIAALVANRVPCSEGLAEHPTIQVVDIGGKCYIGLLGILNGLFGVDEEDWGAIAFVYEDGLLQRAMIRC